MQLQIPTFLLLSLFSLALAAPEANPEPQIAAGGGANTASVVATPMATTTGVPSLMTINGVTTSTWYTYTITFAATALGTWSLGPTPASGSIGLGSIAGTIGEVKNTKRGLDALQTQAPVSL